MGQSPSATAFIQASYNQDLAAFIAECTRIGTGGIAALAQVGTPEGWRAVADIRAGDRVLTFDEGFQTVTRAAPLRVPPVPGAPLQVPRGVLGNREEVFLYPGQSLMIESEAGEMLFGDPFSIVPAEALEHIDRVERMFLRPDLGACRLEFEAEQIVVTRSGMLTHCPPPGRYRDLRIGGYCRLGAEDADVLAMCLNAEGSGPRAWNHNPEILRARALAYA